MRKNVKIIVRMMLSIVLVMIMLGCEIEVYDGAEAEPADLRGMWKTSNTTTVDGKTVTVDKYMTFTFDDFTESSITKTTQDDQIDKMLFFPEQLKFIASYTSMALSLTVNLDESTSRTVIFSDDTKKYLYVKGNSNETYTKFEGDIPKHDLIGFWRSPTVSFPKNSEEVSGYYEWGFGTDGMSKYKVVPELPYFEGGQTRIDGELFVSVLQEGNQVTLTCVEISAPSVRTIIISETDTFVIDSIVYTKQ